MRRRSQPILRTRLLAVGALIASCVACTALSGLDKLQVGDTCVGSCADAAADVHIVQAPGGSCACLAAPEPGWQGPVSVWDGSGAPPACTGDYPTLAGDAFRDPSNPGLGCSSCSCSSPVGIQCPASVKIDIYGVATSLCPAAQKCDTLTLAPGACVYAQANCTIASAVAADLIPTGGSCIPNSAAPPLVPPWSWTHTVRACASRPALPRSSCEPQEVCVPLPAAPMAPRPCIFRDGDLACPAGPYSVKQVAYGGAEDQRSCSPCACGAPAGATCSATIKRGCGSMNSVTLPTKCSALGDPNDVMLTAPPAPAGGRCTPSGGKPAGAVVPTSPTTICCVP